MYKAVAINGSPRKERGYTALLLNSLVEGMREEGAEVELFYASRLKIKPCACGTMHCWYENPGQCCFKDDMQDLYAKMKEAETLILATPVYIPLPGAMQNFINRLCPLVHPFLETRHGRTRAGFREDVRLRRIALVAPGGWWEIENLSTVERIAEELAENGSVAYAGAVLRPHAFVMKSGGELTEDGADVLDAVKKAGQELVRHGMMQPDTLEAIGRPLVGQEELRQRYNALV
jgi:multimeric flavodoxin WrbA